MTQQVYCDVTIRISDLDYSTEAEDRELEVKRDSTPREEVNAKIGAQYKGPLQRTPFVGNCAECMLHS